MVNPQTPRLTEAVGRAGGGNRDQGGIVHRLRIRRNRHDASEHQRHGRHIRARAALLPVDTSLYTCIFIHYGIETIAIIFQPFTRLAPTVFLPTGHNMYRFELFS